jgi:hypothetical protein
MQQLLMESVGFTLILLIHIMFGHLEPIHVLMEVRMQMAVGITDQVVQVLGLLGIGLEHIHQQEKAVLQSALGHILPRMVGMQKVDGFSLQIFQTLLIHSQTFGNKAWHGELLH